MRARWSMGVACALLVAVAPGARAEATAAPGARAEATAAPVDAPVQAERLRAPAVPASFLSHVLPWLDVRYPPSTRDKVAALVSAAERARAELADATGTRGPERVEIRVARGPEEMATLSPEGAPPAPGAAAMAYADLGLIVVSFGTASSEEPTDAIAATRHALAHLALRDATGGRALPVWVDEGFAAHAAEPSSLARRAALVEAALRGRLLSLAELDAALAAGGARAELATAEAAELVRYLREDDRRITFIGMLERVRRGEGFDAAFLDAYGQSAAAMDRELRARATTMWGWVPVAVVLAVLTLATFVVASRRARGPRAEPAALPEAAPRSSAPPRRSSRGRVARVPDPDVPRVEHEGRWHTLH